MAAINHLSNDLNSRRSIIGRKCFIHPSAFASALESMHSHEIFLNEEESIAKNMNLCFSDMKQALELLNQRYTSDEEKQKYPKLKDRKNALKRRTKELVKTMINLTKILLLLEQLLIH